MRVKNRVEVTYEGNEEYTALDTKNERRVAVDCPLTRGEEFGPDGLVAAGIGACMLISMGSFAERHGFDLTGACADVDIALSGQPQARISAVDVTIHVPGNFDAAERAGLEKAADTCPIKHSFGPETRISTGFDWQHAKATSTEVHSRG
jgi:putative redox protein